jgi:hypothetical protein
MVPTYRRENGKYLKIRLKKGIRLIGESTYRRVYTVLWKRVFVFSSWYTAENFFMVYCRKKCLCFFQFWGKCKTLSTILHWCHIGNWNFVGNDNFSISFRKCWNSEIDMLLHYSFHIEIDITLQVNFTFSDIL